jgi:hypothetical protein
VLFDRRSQLQPLLQGLTRYTRTLAEAVRIEVGDGTMMAAVKGIVSVQGTLLEGHESPPDDVTQTTCSTTQRGVLDDPTGTLDDLLGGGDDGDSPLDDLLGGGSGTSTSGHDSGGGLLDILTGGAS